MEDKKKKKEDKKKRETSQKVKNVYNNSQLTKSTCFSRNLCHIPLLHFFNTCLVGLFLLNWLNW